MLIDVTGYLYRCRSCRSGGICNKSWTSRPDRNQGGSSADTGPTSSPGQNPADSSDNSCCRDPNTGYRRGRTDHKPWCWCCQSDWKEEKSPVWGFVLNLRIKEEMLSSSVFVRPLWTMLHTAGSLFEKSRFTGGTLQAVTARAGLTAEVTALTHSFVPVLAVVPHRTAQHTGVVWAKQEHTCVN